MSEGKKFESFSEEMRVKSQAIHDKSDKLVNLKLAIALTNNKLYGEVIRDFYTIFVAIEEQVEKHKENQYINHIWLPELTRKSAFEQDLEFFLGAGWRENGKPSQAALDYAAHICTATDEEPELLLAYIHTMYLAILSGGYILKKLITNSLGISGEDGGVAGLEIPPGATRAQLKHHIKSSIDQMDLDPDLKERIVQEKISIFRRNNTIVASIKPTWSSGARIFKLLSVFVGSCALVCYFCFKR